MSVEVEVPEVSVREACRILREDPDAVLLDVRTAAEWDFVGVPLVSNYAQVEWRLYPEMTINPDFLAEVEALGLPKRGRILCLCKSGGRSCEAVAFLLQNGYSECHNVREGFEGERNAIGQRRCVNGWIAEGLPWMQC